jgi:hypothetical protein
MAKKLTPFSGERRSPARQIGGNNLAEKSVKVALGFGTAAVIPDVVVHPT